MERMFEKYNANIRRHSLHQSSDRVGLRTSAVCQIGLRAIGPSSSALCCHFGLLVLEATRVR